MTAPVEGGFRIPPGARLNGIYEIERLIAVGGMGEVFAGRAIETGVPVAIKMIRPELAADPAIMGLFRREALALHQLRHEAIVAYYVFSVDPQLNAAYLAMEFVPGRALSDLAREGGPLGFDFVHTLQRRVASGLQAAHQLGVIHRDVSSDNIILPDGDPARAKIIDFGIAKNTLDTSTIIGSGFAGKNNYVSPEQLGLGGGVITAKSDVYSLGLVLVEALLGRPLDMGGNLAEVIAKREGVPDLTGVDQRMKPLIRRMLDPDPERRPSMAEIATHEAPPLEAVAPPDPTIVRETLSRDATRIKDMVSRRVAPTAPPRPMRRNRAPLILVGGAAAAALLAIGAFLLWPSPSPPPRMAASSAPATIQLEADPPPTAADPATLARREEEERRRQDEIAANEQRAAQERAAREEQERLARLEQEQRRQAEEAQRREAAEAERRRQAEAAAAEQQRLAQEREARARQEEAERRRQAEAREAEQRRLEQAERDMRVRREQEAERRRQAEAAAAEQQRLAREQAERTEREARARREQEQEAERRRQAEAAAAEQQRLAREQAERTEREARARQDEENERRRQADAAVAEQQRLARVRAELAESEAAARREQEQENERRRQAEAEAARRPPQVALRSDATSPVLPASRDCSQCPDLVAVPEGVMQMGSNRDPSERPIRPVSVKSFMMSRYPVTVAQWRECVRAAACAYDAKGDDNSPVNNVSLDDAQQYIAWLSKATGRNYRLPTEAEWEYAARGGAKTRYWWGEEFSADFAGCRRCGPSRAAPWPVGNFKPNAFGLYDMTGNVGQWVSDCWHKDYRGAPRDSSSWSAGRCREQVVRGGSWTSEPADQTVTSRSFYDPGVRHPSYGFRVVRSP